MGLGYVPSDAFNVDSSHRTNSLQSDKVEFSVTEYPHNG